MIFDNGFDGQKEIDSGTIWSDWMRLSNLFSPIQEKIRERRRMYKLWWTPADVTDVTAKRWRDYVIDPLPRNDIDFKADRLTARPLMIRVPTEQLDIDTVDILNNQNAFQGISPQTDLMDLTRKMKEIGRDMAQKRADAIEKYLNGTLYINTVMRKEHLQLRWAMHLLVDGYAGYCVYYDSYATDDEYPIIIRALDPLNCVYERGDQKTDVFIYARQDYVQSLRREFGSSIFSGMSDMAIVYVIDYWRRVKVKTRNQLDGSEKYVPEVWHATLLNNAGISGDIYSASNVISLDASKRQDALGFALKPSKTDYIEIPCDVIEARVTPLTEDKEELVAGDLDAARAIWESRNYLLTRMHRLAKLGSNADLVTKGIDRDALQRVGKGEGVTVTVPSDSQINPADAMSWSKPPPYDPNLINHDLALNQMLQQTLIPITSLGNRGGTVSGAQVDQLDQGAAVRLQTYVNAMNLLNTSWARNCMQVAAVFYKDPSQQITVYGIDRNASPFATKISAADINGDFTVFVDVNPKTSFEQLQEALTALRLTSNDPGAAIISKQTLREQFLQTQYNWQEENRIKREAEEMDQDIIKASASRGIADAQLQIIANLEQIRVQSIIQGAPPNPILDQLMMQLQQQLLKGFPAGVTSGGGNNGSNNSGLILPTNEGAAPAFDQRTYPPTSPAQQSFAMAGGAARQGMPVSTNGLAGR